MPRCGVHQNQYCWPQECLQEHHLDELLCTACSRYSKSIKCVGIFDQQGAIIESGKSRREASQVAVDSSLYTSQKSWPSLKLYRNLTLVANCFVR